MSPHQGGGTKSLRGESDSLFVAEVQQIEEWLEKFALQLGALSHICGRAVYALGPLQLLLFRRSDLFLLRLIRTFRTAGLLAA
jgi:hypothetical protein